MKRLYFILMLLMAVTISYGQGMSDTQVMDFVQREAQAGTSQSQIVTKLIQRGVKIDQIRRIRAQYQSQLQKRGMTGAADAAVAAVESRMRTNNSGQQAQEVVAAKQGTATEVYQEADVEYAQIQENINTKQANVVEQIDGKKVFGRDIFNNKLLSFEPNMNLATPQNYVLGPGDQVIIDIYGASQKSEQLTVSPDGAVTVPGYGPIAVSGLTVAAAQAKIRSSLGTRYASSAIKLTVGQTRTIMVNVMGEVRVPGTYTLSAFATVFHALYMAGGISDLGTLRNIRVIRQGRQVTVVDVYEYILNGRLAGNVRLQDNDVIQVGAYDCLVGITGNVKRPMFYEMRSNESVSTLLNYAGGFTGDAYKKSLRLVRKTESHFSVFNVGEFDMSTFKVADGDAVEVDGILNRYENMVEVTGAVFRPGKYELGNEINSVKTLIEHADGITEDAFTGRAVIHRMKEDRTLEVLSVDVQGILDGTVADIPLKNEDRLFIPTQAERVNERTLTITGEVMSPGTYEFADNTTIEDLIVMAGGLTDQASLAKVDVSRRILDPKATTKTREIAKSYTFELKDGLMINGAKNFLLEPYDVVHVRKSPVFSTARNFSIAGEVNYEGEFTIENKNMRLSDAIRMAGGLTEDAYLRGARLVRLMNEEERVRAAASREAINKILTERGDSIAWDKMDADSTYLVGIELDEAIKNPGGDHDILLREGDQIFVPEYNATVKISGDVFFPNTVFYEAGKGYKHYVNMAGGFGHSAKKSKSFIVYQNGTVGVVSKGAKPEPGCEIIVPSKKRKQPFNWSSVAAITSGLTGIAALILAISRL